MTPGYWNIFDITDAVQQDKVFHIHLDEKHVALSGYENISFDPKALCRLQKLNTSLFAVRKLRFIQSVFSEKY